MAPKRFKRSQFRKGDLDFNFECTNLLLINFRKQRYIPLNATIPGQDSIYPKTHLCRTFLLSIFEGQMASLVMIMVSFSSVAIVHSLN